MARLKRTKAYKGAFSVNVLPTLPDILKQFDKLEEGLVAAAAMSARKEGVYQLLLSQELVPVSTREQAARRGRLPGQLLASGRVEGPDMSRGRSTVAVEIAYGGPAGAGGNFFPVDYALAVHEDLYAKHRVGQAKYLSTVVDEEASSGRMVERMAADIKQKMGWQ